MKVQVSSLKNELGLTCGCIGTFRVFGNEAEVGFALRVEAEAYLADLSPNDVIVQVYSGPLDPDRNIVGSSVENMKPVEPLHDGVHRFEGYIACDESGLFGYSVRIRPLHAEMSEQFGLEYMRWIGDSVEHQTKETALMPVTV